MRVTTVENQRKCILPMNDISATLFYNQRIVLSAPLKTPVTWHCSKVEQTAPKGISRLTFVQELWNSDTDAFEYYPEIPGATENEFSKDYLPDRKLAGMWCDYYLTNIPPINPDDEHPKTDVYGKISYTNPATIRIKGGYKKFNIHFFDDETEISLLAGEWSFKITDENGDFVDTVHKKTEDGIRKLSDDKDDWEYIDFNVNDLISIKTNEDELKLKFVDDDYFIGRKLQLIYTTTLDHIETSMEVEIVG